MTISATNAVYILQMVLDQFCGELSFRYLLYNYNYYRYFKMALLWNLVILFTTVTMTHAVKCNMPPSLWCSSKETAQRCGVLDQCIKSLPKDTEEGPVNFTLYYGSLCNACLAMIQLQIYPTYMALGESVLNLTMVPYGNAKEKKTKTGHWKFDCQRGEEECVVNVIESCVLNMQKNKTEAFLFIHCLDNDIPEFPKAAKRCAPKFDIDYDTLMTCANGDQGEQLEHEMAVITGKLSPPHTYVPWVTLNGVHTEKINDQAMEDLMSLICKTYKGPTPDACKKHEAIVKLKQNKCQRN